MRNKKDKKEKQCTIYSYATALSIIHLPLCLFVFFSCTETSRQSVMPPATGKAGEIIMVIDDIKWNAGAGKVIRSCLASENTALPQPEPVFSLLQLQPAEFKGIFKNHRNIFMVKSDASENTFTLRHDVYATGQVVAEIKTTSDSGIFNLFGSNCAAIAEQFNRAERFRLISGYEKLKDDYIIKQISGKHSIQLMIPRGYQLAKNDKNFVWLKRELEEGHQGIFIYEFPYISASVPEGDTAVFTPDRIRFIRDSVCKINVPGPTTGSYMITSPDFTLQVKKIKFKNYPALEVRGLWQVFNDFMGGPFIALVVFDSKKHRLVFIEGYVYAPNREKREYLRQAEAIVYSAELN